MENFVYHVPTEIVFGRGTQRRTPELVRKYGGSRVLIVYGGGSAVKSGLIGELKTLLKDAGIESAEFGGAKPNPTLTHAREGVRFAIEYKADFILAAGGGSAIDTAKAVAHGLAAPDTDIWEFWSGRVKPVRTTPFGVILTIPAAGSETCDSAVLTNTEIPQKRGLTTRFNRPLFAIMNPELAASLPEFQVACGVTDIMMHTLDRYFNPIANEMTDAIAEALLRTVITEGRTAVQNPSDYTSMSEIMWAGSLSHNGLTGLGGNKDFACHQLGHALSTRYNTTHGASLSMIWASWARYVCDANYGRFARYARNVWEIREEDDRQAALEGIRATESYFDAIGVPVFITDADGGRIDDSECRILANLCSYGGTRTIGTFKVLAETDMYRIFSAAAGLK